MDWARELAVAEEDATLARLRRETASGRGQLYQQARGAVHAPPARTAHGTAVHAQGPGPPARAQKEKKCLSRLDFPDFPDFPDFSISDETFDP